MNYSLITSAGVGSRMKLGYPKQYCLVNGRPLIAYTLQAFESCPLIDGICLVVSDSYLLAAKTIISTFHFKKVKWIAVGGDTNQMSIWNGIQAMDSDVEPDDIILVHDGIRPLVSEEVIEDSVNVCQKYGNAVAVTPCNEAMLFSEGGNQSTKSIDRSLLVKTQTPHAMHFGDLHSLMERTISKGIHNSVAVCTMLIEDGQVVHFSKGNNLNFKLTQPEDLDLFRGILKTKNEK